MSEKRFSGFSNNFGAIRILLAIAVVFSDSFLLGDGVTNADPIKRFDHGQAITGHVAVDLFFIMSGYLVTLSLMRDASLPRYFWHRIRRVYPGFILAAVFSFLVVLPLSGGSITPPVRLGAAGDFVYRTLRLGSPTYSGAFPANPFPGEVNLPLWSIPYGFLCYILAAVLSAIGVLRSQWRVWILTTLEGIAITFGVWALVAHFFPEPHWVTVTIGYPGMWARVLPMFLSGMLLAAVKDRMPVNGWIAVAAVAVLAHCGTNSAGMGTDDGHRWSVSAVLLRIYAEAAAVAGDGVGRSVVWNVSAVVSYSTDVCADVHTWRARTDDESVFAVCGIACALACGGICEFVDG